MYAIYNLEPSLPPSPPPLFLPPKDTARKQGSFSGASNSVWVKKMEAVGLGGGEKDNMQQFLTCKHFLLSP